MARSGVRLSGSAILVLAGLAIAWYLYEKLKGGTGELANAIGGGLYDLIHGDANVAVQGQFATIMTQLKAKGSPNVGTDTYNAIMVDNGRPDLAIQNNLTTIWPAIPSSQLPVNAS